MGPDYLLVEFIQSATVPIMPIIQSKTGNSSDKIIMENRLGDSLF